MRVHLHSKGDVPVVNGRVRVCGLVYYVTSVEEPTDLDGETFITECDIQPADGGKGAKIIDTKLVPERKP